MTDLSHNGAVGRTVDLEHIGPSFREAVRFENRGSVLLHKRVLQKSGHELVPATVLGWNVRNRLHGPGDHYLELVIHLLHHFTGECAIGRG